MFSPQVFLVTTPDEAKTYVAADRAADVIAAICEMVDDFDFEHLPCTIATVADEEPVRMYTEGLAMPGDVPEGGRIDYSDFGSQFIEATAEQWAEWATQKGPKGHVICSTWWR